MPEHYGGQSAGHLHHRIDGGIIRHEGMAQRIHLDAAEASAVHIGFDLFAAGLRALERVELHERDKPAQLPKSPICACASIFFILPFLSALLEACDQVGGLHDRDHDRAQSRHHGDTNDAFQCKAHSNIISCKLSCMPLYQTVDCLIVSVHWFLLGAD